MKCQKCNATFRDTGKWARIRAHSAGWYQKRDDTWYCPAHRPKWAQPPSAPSKTGEQ